jgi:hypothetical protein
MKHDIPEKYLAGLTPEQRLRQMNLLQRSRRVYETTGEIQERPKVSETKSPRSPWVVKFQEKHGFPITDLEKVKKAYPNADVEMILKKGAGAYASSGSRPNQTSYSWKFARLASALLGGPAARVDRNLL